MRASLPHRDITQATIGCFFRVYAELGYGLPEPHYASALALELSDCGLGVRREYPIDVRYRGRRIGQLRADVIVAECVLLELKAGPKLDPFALRQLYNYLRCSELEVGLLLYFGPEPLIRRLDCPNHLKGTASSRHEPRPRPWKGEEE